MGGVGVFLDLFIRYTSYSGVSKVKSASGSKTLELQRQISHLPLAWHAAVGL